MLSQMVLDRIRGELQKWCNDDYTIILGEQPCDEIVFTAPWARCVVSVSIVENILLASCIHGALVHFGPKHDISNPCFDESDIKIIVTWMIRKTCYYS